MTDMPDWDDDILGEDTVEESLIELTDIVDERSGEAAGGVIELTDVVQDEPLEPEKVDAPIELTDIVKEEASDIDFGLDDVEEDSLDVDENFIDEEVSSFDDEPELEELQLPEGEDESFEELVVEASAASIPVPDGSVPEMNVDIKDIEAALDRVIEKKFGDKIESILFEVMEKVIEKEIIQIKNSLQVDVDQIENG